MLIDDADNSEPRRHDWDWHSAAQQEQEDSGVLQLQGEADLPLGPEVREVSEVPADERSAGQERPAERHHHLRVRRLRDSAEGQQERVRSGLPLLRHHHFADQLTESNNHLDYEIF